MQITTGGASRKALSKSAGPFTYVRPLTCEEEQALARTYRDGRDPAIARTLIESHLPLVMKIARQCSRRPAMLPDLIQEGCLGLIRAVEKYDPDRNVRLSSYAAWWIRAFVYQYLMANSRIMRLATTYSQRKLFFNLKRECDRLERDGEEAAPAQIAQNLGVTEKAVIEMRGRLGGREVPFDTIFATEAGTAGERVDGALVPRPADEMVEDHQVRQGVARKLGLAVATMNDRERAILSERLMADTPTTLRDLGRRFGIGRERARQLESDLKRRLRPIMSEFRDDAPQDPHGRLRLAA
jgi:RNA polymerase sigma-32 factor